MKGNNELKINHATMVEIIDDYIDDILITSQKNFSVYSVEWDGSMWFVVRLEENYDKKKGDKNDGNN